MLLDAYERDTGGIRDQMDREAGSAGIGPYTFYGKSHDDLPGEVKQFLEGHPDAKRMLRSVFHMTQDRAYAGGEDAMASLGDKYWQIAEARAGKTIEQAVEHGLKSDDPELQMNAHIWKNMPPAGERQPFQMRDPKAMATHAEFDVQGHHFQIVEDPDGVRLLKDGDDYPALPADHVGKIPIDKGSIKAPSEAEPELPDEPFAPDAETPTRSAASGGGGGGTIAGNYAPAAGGLHNLPPITPTGATVTTRNINPIQMPELFKLATELLAGKYPQATGRLRKMLGRFKYSIDPATGKAIKDSEGIDLNRKALGESPEQLAATMSHEIGHLVDWLPDKTLAPATCWAGWRRSVTSPRTSCRARHSATPASAPSCWR